MAIGHKKVRGTVVAIVPAAGSGRRMGMRTPKPFVKLAGRPLVWHALDALERSKAVDAVVIACERSCMGRFRRLVSSSGFRKVAAIVEGGRERSDSVRNALERVGRSCGIVLIHDGARPLVDARTIEASVRAASRYGGCVAAVPESDTVKAAGRDLFIDKTLDRKRIYRAQTPQAFRRAIIEKAYAAAGAHEATDDAALVERAGGRVKIVPGSYRNIKITTKEDIKIAEALL